MPKVTALRGFDWYPDAPNKRATVLEGQTIDVTDEQAKLLVAHGHIAESAPKAVAKAKEYAAAAESLAAPKASPDKD